LLTPSLTLSGAGQQCEVQIAACDPNSPYRTIDGSCNNLRQPRWGMTGSLFTRLLPPRYADGNYYKDMGGLPRKI
jgi:peroxidase